MQMDVIQCIKNTNDMYFIAYKNYYIYWKRMVGEIDCYNFITINSTNDGACEYEEDTMDARKNPITNNDDSRNNDNHILNSLPNSGENCVGSGAVAG